MREADVTTAMLLGMVGGWRTYGPALPMWRAPKPMRKGDHDQLDADTDRRALVWLADKMTRTARRVKPDAPRWTLAQAGAAFGPADRRRLWLAHLKRERKAAARRERGGL